MDKEKFGQFISQLRKEKGMTRSKRKVAIIIGLIIGLIPVIAITFAVGCIYLIKYEKTVDDAILTLVFMIFVAIILLIKYGIPLLGITLTTVLYNSKLLNNDIKLKKAICIILYFIFGIWLMFSVSILLKNIIYY